MPEVASELASDNARVGVRGVAAARVHPRDERCGVGFFFEPEAEERTPRRAASASALARSNA